MSRDTPRTLCRQGERRELHDRTARPQDEADRKPGSVPPLETKQAAMIIHLGHTLPCASSDRTRRHRASHPYPTGGPQWDQVGVPLYLVLLRVGFTELPMSPLELVRSYRTVSPLPGHCVRQSCRSARRPGGLFSVALSLGSPPLDVIQHPALWSPDFPPLVG